jgi:glucokinase
MSNDNRSVRQCLEILQHVRQAGQLTRRDIAERLELSFSLSSNLTNDLLARNLIRETGRSESIGGRPADLLSISPDGGYAVGLEISGTSQRGVVVNLCGEVLVNRLEAVPDFTDHEGIVNDLENFINQVIEQSGIQKKCILGVGVGLWGMVDPTTGIVGYWTETPSWTRIWLDFALKDALKARLPYPHISVDDMIRMRGIAEVQYGGHPKGEDFVYVLADSAIGIAIIINGLPYTGSGHISGELGHVLLGSGNTTPTPLPCGCGNVGCLETMASTNAILNRIRQRLSDSVVQNTLLWQVEGLTIQDVIRAGEQGDRLAYQYLTEAGEYLGSGLALVLNLLGPRRLVVGGILSGSAVYMEAAKRMIKLQSLNKITNGLVIEQSRLDEWGNARGAATAVLNALFVPGGVNLLSLRESG